MIDFRPLTVNDKQEYDRFLLDGTERGCEYSFANLYLWGRQMSVLHQGNLAFFSQFNRKSVYLFPAGCGDLKPTLDAIIEDASKRGIPCRLTGLLENDRELLKQLYPDRFRFHIDRDCFDYVYAIEDLATLGGRKYQKKRNHLNRFRQNHPEYRAIPITDALLPKVSEFLDTWYQAQGPEKDFHMERAALKKALRNLSPLEMESLVLMDGDVILAMTLGSRLNRDTFDIHFEKALEDGAYAAVNYEFARRLQEKYPDIQWLNREDDLGLEGLRKAKLSYHPDHLVEKCWACLLEDGYDY